jgi:hypothetical protein
MLTLSNHASVRSRQRAIPDMVIDLLLQFGAREKAPGGTCKAYFNKASRRQLKQYAGPLASLLEPHLDAFLVLARDDKVITVGHRTERVLRH